MQKETKLSLALFIAAFASLILHNAIFGLFKLEEPIFFMLFFVFLLAFGLSLAVNITTYVRIKKPEDLWKLGYLGLFGLLGILPKFGTGFFGFFGFFGLFGTKVDVRKRDEIKNITKKSRKRRIR